MAETETQGPLIPDQTKRATVVLAYLFLYSVAMFTLPFVAFFGVKNTLYENFSFTTYASNVWGAIAAVIVVNIIICMYAFKAYYEKEYDEHGNEIDQHAYPPMPENSDKNSLNLKED